MPIQFENRELNRDSSFEEIASYAIKTHYHPPYFERMDKRPHDVNRFYHGGVHASSATLNLKLCLELYQFYCPDLLENPDGSPLNIKLIKLAVLYHDSANLAETSKNTHHHADNFRRDMLLLGYTHDEIETIAWAMENKDGTLDKRKASKEEIAIEVAKKNITQKLLASADCIDNVRTVGNAFDTKHLDILYDLSKFDGFEKELHQIIEHHKNTVKHFQKVNNKTSAKHLECEFAENCYLAVKQFYSDLFYQYLAAEAEKLSKPLIETDRVRFTLRDVYNPENSQNVKTFLYDEDVLVQYNNFGLIVRVLQHANVNDELNVIKQNNKVLKDLNLSEPEQLRAYLIDQEKKGRDVVAPPGFKWRPATFVRKKLPVVLYGNKKNPEGIILIISATHNKTKIVFGYKGVILSNIAKNNRLKYLRNETTRAKGLDSINDLADKLSETNDRRNGLKEDTYLRHLGHPTLECTEVLLSSYEKIIGIGVIGFTKKAMLMALKERETVQNPKLKLYRYSIKDGFREITQHEIEKQMALADAETGIVEIPPTELELKSIELEKELNIHNVTNIVNLAESKRVSFLNPVKFKFNLNGNECFAYMKDGMPCIEFNKNGENIIIIDSKSFLREIYKKYCEQTIEALNLTLTDIDCHTQLKSMGINALLFTLITRSNKRKLYVRMDVKFDNCSIHNKDNATAYLKLILGDFGKKLEHIVASVGSESGKAYDIITADIPMLNIAALKKQVPEAIQTNNTSNISSPLEMESPKKIKGKRVSNKKNMIINTVAKNEPRNLPDKAKKIDVSPEPEVEHKIGSWVKYVNTIFGGYSYRRANNFIFFVRVSPCIESNSISIHIHTGTNIEYKELHKKLHAELDAINGVKKSDSIVSIEITSITEAINFLDIINRSNIENKNAENSVKEPGMLHEIYADLCETIGKFLPKMSSEPNLDEKDNAPIIFQTNLSQQSAMTTAFFTKPLFKKPDAFNTKMEETISENASRKNCL